MQANKCIFCRKFIAFLRSKNPRWIWHAYIRNTGHFSMQELMTCNCWPCAVCLWLHGNKEQHTSWYSRRYKVCINTQSDCEELWALSDRKCPIFLLTTHIVIACIRAASTGWTSHKWMCVVRLAGHIVTHVVSAVLCVLTFCISTSNTTSCVLHNLRVNRSKYIQQYINSGVETPYQWWRDLFRCTSGELLNGI